MSPDCHAHSKHMLFMKLQYSMSSMHSFLITQLHLTEEPKEHKIQPGTHNVGYLNLNNNIHAHVN